MKKAFILITVAIFALAMIGCPNMFSGKSNTPAHGTDSEGYGTVSVSLIQGSARTAMPEFVWSSFEMEYTFIQIIGGEEHPEVKSPEPEQEVTLGYSRFVLKQGKYRLEVKAFYLEGSVVVLAATGETGEFDIIAGLNQDIIEVTLRPVGVQNDYTGTLQFTFELDSGINSANVTVNTFTLHRIFAPEFPPYDFSSNFDDGKITKEVSSGYYLLHIILELKNGNTYSYASKTGVVHIYDLMPTEETYSFVSEDFASNVVVNNKDYNITSPEDPISGSLRHALANADVGSTIRVMLSPGTEIELADRLIITKNVTIEGNSVILTSRSAMEESRPLFEIQGSEVTINRVHFKGRESKNINAIDVTSAGILTVQSCIFSGNKAGYGGAISNGGDLYVKGCTFYNNAANDMGGAIYNTGLGTVTLLGNIFYGNTAANGFQVVHNNTSNPVTTSGYNVVDVPFGSASTECGWSYGYPYNDKHVTDLTFSPVNFKLLPGSKEKLPAIPGYELSNYPRVDFYGNPIVAEAAPGAVQEQLTSGFYLDVVNTLEGQGYEVSADLGDPDENGLWSSSVTLTTVGPNLNTLYWMIDGIPFVNQPTTRTLNDSETWSGYIQVKIGMMYQPTDWSDLATCITSSSGSEEMVILLPSDFQAIAKIEIGNSYMGIQRITLVANDPITISRGFDTIYSETYSGEFFNIGGGGTLTLGLPDMPGEITIDGVTASPPVEKPLIIIKYAPPNNGTLIMNKGVMLTGNSNTADSGNLGGAVYAGGDFIMNGGDISDNVCTNGGGVFVDNGTFTVNGGTISGNKADNNGGGIFVGEDGIFTMIGGTIENNEAKSRGGGVYVSMYGTMNKSGGTIYGTNEGSNSNTALVPEGHAVFVDETTTNGDILRPKKERNATAGSGVNLNSQTGDNWQ